MTDTIKAVEIRAEIRQIRTMADGTINVILNLPEDCKEQVKVMLDWQGYEVKAVLVSPDKQVKSGNDKFRPISTGAKRQSVWKATEKPRSD